MSELFIPKKIKVGYQKRDGTYTGRLAYVIYYDNKGVLRKEKSWQGWRDHKIAPEEFDNKPQDGFCLNKDVKRFNWSHFGSNRSYIRMYDPRGIEMEITPENLIGILTETDCLKRGLEGKFVYAWQGTELVILPCNSEEYTKAQQNTERQDQDVSAKDLKPGHSYTTKKGEEVIYLGRFPWFEWSHYDKTHKKAAKYHTFAHPEKPQYGGSFFKKSDVKFLALLNSTDPVINYAELIDNWNSDPRSASTQSWEFSPVTVTDDDVFEKDINKHPYVKKQEIIERNGDTITFSSVQANKRYGSNKIEFYIRETGSLNTVTMAYNQTSCGVYGSSSYHRYHNPVPITREQVLERIQKSTKVKMVLTNGKKIPIKNIYDVAR